MPIKVILNIDGVSDAMGTAAYGTAAKAIVERGTAVDSGFAAAGTVALVSTTSQYEWWDGSGTTSSWYRFRLFDGSSGYSAYSDAWRATALVAYATLDDLLERINMPDESRYNLLSDLLVDISGQLDAECGRQFYRIPQVSGTTTRTYDGDGSDTLLIPEGIVSITTISVYDQQYGTATALGANDYVLRPSHPAPGWPYSRVILTGEGTYANFTSGFGTVSITGVFGWSAVPELVHLAVLERAQEAYHQSQTREAGTVGLPEMGTWTIPNQPPSTWLRAIRLYGRRAGLAV